jgi:hypothetical protein
MADPTDGGRANSVSPWGNGALIGIGAGIGATIGVLFGGGIGIALGVAMGAAMGTVAGAVVTSWSRRTPTGRPPHQP